MTRAVDVGIVPVVGGELNVGSRDGDTTLTLLRGLINGTILKELSEALRSLVLGDSGSQGGLNSNVLESGLLRGKKSINPVSRLPCRDRRDQWYL